MRLVVLLVVLGALETIGTLLITHRLLPPMAAVIVEAIVVNWTVVAMFVFTSPLWGKVEVAAVLASMAKDSVSASVGWGAYGCRWKPSLVRPPARLRQELRFSLALASTKSPGNSAWSGQPLRRA